MVQKFRGKRKDNGKWVAGVPVPNSFCNVVHMIPILLTDKVAYPPERLHEYLIEIEPETLGQSTGLKDKNGMEIFEWDIVIRANEAIGYVAYLQQEAGFVVVTKKSDYRLGHRNTGETYDVATAHEVIGNIYSKPKLWEQANEN